MIVQIFIVILDARLYVLHRKVPILYIPEIYICSIFYLTIRQSLKVYSKIAINEAQKKYDKVINKFSVK